MPASQEIFFEVIKGVGGNIGVMVLNRPEVLNSLNLSMIHAIHAQLTEWKTSTDIKAVVIRAVPGRAFCAGGDIRATYEYQSGHNPGAAYFFRDEYQLNRCIFHYPKPYIAFLDGITMGGGVGISIHGSHRVATQQLMFSMPETGIGFFPDVGGTYFLPRLPGKIGHYLGLTGARIGCDDSVAIGIAQHKLDSSDLPKLLTLLANTPFSLEANHTVSQIISQFEIPIDHSDLLSQQTIIDECFSHSTIEEVVHAVTESNHDLCQFAVKAFPKKSPTSLKVTLKALQEGKHLDFDTCMKHEFRLATRFNESHDFHEGIRAVIIDKDQAPDWKPGSLEAVSSEIVDAYFSPLAQELA